MKAGGRGVRMNRADLSDLPRASLPEPFRLREYEPGDEAAWLSIHRRADEYNTFTASSFVEQFGRDPGEIGRRQIYLLDASGHPVGTTTAWYASSDPGVGMIHWVAILPDYQGRGLARPLLARACRRLRDLGHERAFLSTDTARVPAICLYFDFGFVPNLETADAREAWQDFLARAAHEPRADAVREFVRARV